MQNDNDLPTDRSLEMEDPKLSPNHSKTSFIQTSSQMMIQKMMAHLTFIQNEFSRNMEWQKYLLSQIQAEHHHPQKDKNKQNEDTFKLLPNQQSKLKEILICFLGCKDEQKSLKTLINEASLTLKNKQSISQKNQIEEKLEFPIVQRVVTLQDLNPLSQRQLPSTLPPKTPKKKDLKGKKEGREDHQFLTFTPQILLSNSSSEAEYKSEQKCSRPGKVKKEGFLGDSLGKRLFQEQKENLIKIQDPPEDQNIGSQVSLTLSMSEYEKIPSIEVFQIQKPKKTQISYSLKQNNFEYQSIYIQGPLISSREGKNSEKEEDHQNDGLSFRDFPRRKIGKCHIKKQNYFCYQEGQLEKVRKMHDSFGQAYQEYYLSESSTNRKQSCLYRGDNSKIRKID